MNAMRFRGPHLNRPPPPGPFCEFDSSSGERCGRAGGGPAAGPLGGMGGTPLSACPGGWMTGEVTVNCL